MNRSDCLWSENLGLFVFGFFLAAFAIKPLSDELFDR
jgi:hypothetical protein